MSKLLERNLEGFSDIREMYYSTHSEGAECDAINCGWENERNQLLTPQLEGSAFINLCCLKRLSHINAEEQAKKPIIETPFLL